jgi:hypothetical protein
MTNHTYSADDVDTTTVLVGEMDYYYDADNVRRYWAEWPMRSGDTVEIAMKDGRSIYGDVISVTVDHVTIAVQ